MSIGYLCNVSKELTVSVWYGLTTSTEWRANLEQFEQDPQYARTTLQLVDLRAGVADASIDEAQISAATQFLNDRPKVIPRKLAVVAGQDYEKVKYFVSHLKVRRVTVIVFNQVSTACQWLGVDVSDVERMIEEIVRQLGEGGKEDGELE